MKSKIISSVLILSLFCSSIALSKEVITETTPFDNSIEANNIQNNKTNLIAKLFGKKTEAKNEANNTNETKQTEDKKLADDGKVLTKQEIDEIQQAKKNAVEYANQTIFGEYYQESEKSLNDIVESGIKEDIKNDENITVEGYIQETLIYSLDDCIKKALENNPEIRSAFSNSEIYKTHIGQAWSNYFPHFNFTSGYTRNRYLAINFPVPQKMYSFYNTGNINATQLIFDFGKTKALADVSKRTYEATLANLDETVNKIVYDVKEAYYSLLYSLEKQNVYQDSVASYELQLKQAQAFYDIGTKAKIDVTMAQYNLGNAQLGLVKAKNEVKLATAQLNNAMGLPEENDYKILDKLSMKEYTYDFNDLIEKAYETRPQLISFKKKAKASEILIKSSKRAFFPDIEGIGNFQVGGGGRFDDDYGWTVGAQFSYKNTNIMLLKKQMDEAKATHQKDVADLEVEEHNVYLQVKQAYINLKNAEESIPITALSLKHAKEQFDLASGRYRVGVGDAIELKDSETTYRTARLDYLASLLQYNISVADLERVVGFKLQEINIEE